MSPTQRIAKLEAKLASAEAEKVVDNMARKVAKDHEWVRRYIIDVRDKRIAELEAKLASTELEAKLASENGRQSRPGPHPEEMMV